RGAEFVTRKVTQHAARIKLGLADRLKMGNLDAQRDWGYAGDYICAMWLMLQQTQPDDYVIATGETHSIQELLDVAFSYVGLDWKEMAKVDPLWAILSHAEERFHKWNLDDFLRTGQDEIETLMESANQLGLPKRRRCVIDFGCGVGRLTRALHNYFPECHGVDISASMVERARKLS